MEKPAWQAATASATATWSCRPRAGRAGRRWTCAPDEPEGGEVADFAGVEVGLEGEVELIEGLVVRQPGELQRVAEPAALPHPDLFLEHQVEEVQVAQLCGLGPGGQRRCLVGEVVSSRRSACRRIRSATSLLIGSLRHARHDRVGVVGQRVVDREGRGGPPDRHAGGRAASATGSSVSGSSCRWTGARVGERDRPGVPVGQPVPVRGVDLIQLPRCRRPPVLGEQPRIGADARGSRRVAGPTRSSTVMPGPNSTRRDRVAGGLEGDQAVLADPAQDPVGRPDTAPAAAAPARPGRPRPAPR